MQRPDLKVVADAPDRPRGLVRRTGSGLAKIIVVTLLLGAALAVSVGLASTGGERPSTGPQDLRRDAPPASEAADVEPPATSEPSTPLDNTTAVDPLAELDADALAEGQAAAELVDAEEERLLALVRGIPFGARPYRADSGAIVTVVLTARDEAYGLDDLQSLGAVITLDDGSLYQQLSVMVAPGARLVVDAPGTLLRLRSDEAGFASLVSWKADLRLRGASDAPLSLVGWDLAAGAADKDVTDGRAYVRAIGSRTEMQDVGLKSLGFWSGRTGGLALTGETPDTADVATDRSRIEGVTTAGLHYGLFASGTNNLTIKQSAFRGSAMDGVLLHGGARNTLMTSTTTSDNGQHGIAMSRGSTGLGATGVVSTGNAGVGLSVRGTPLADGATAGGAAPRRYGDIDVSKGTFVGNAVAGASFTDTRGVSMRRSQVEDSVDGIVIRGRAQDVLLGDNQVRGVGGFGIAVLDGATGVDVTGNDVTGSSTGIAVRSSVATVRDNTVRSATDHGISLTARSPGSQVVDNVLAGSGPAAIGLSRLESARTVVVNGNDIEGWEDQAVGTWWERLAEHPLLLVWLVVLGIPVVVLLTGLTLTLLRRVRRPRPQAHSALIAQVPEDEPASLAAAHPANEYARIGSTTRVTVIR